MSHVKEYGAIRWAVCAAVALAAAAVASAAPGPVARITTGPGPCGASSGFGSVWVAVYGTGRLRVYNVGGNPSGLAAAGGSLWIAFSRSGTSLGRLDPATGKLTRIPIRHSAPGFLSLLGGSIWTTTGDGYAVRVDPTTDRVTATFPIPGTPAEVAAAPDGTIWVAEKERNTLTRIDPTKNRIVDVTPAGRGAFAIAVAASDMWVTSFAGNDVWRFSVG